MRTHQTDGLVLFAGSSGVVDSDFLAIELVSGQIRYVFDTGGGPRSIRSATGFALGDGAWHRVAVDRADLRRHVLMVDKWSAEDVTSQETKSIHFDLNDDVYVGGVSVATVKALPRQLRSASGFHGCVASFTLNGKTKNLLDLSLNPTSAARNPVKGDCQGDPLHHRLPSSSELCLSCSCLEAYYCLTLCTCISQQCFQPIPSPTISFSFP